MSVKKQIFVLIISSLMILVSGCSPSKDAAEAKYITGIIVVVGNEPFTNLAVQTGPSEVVILDCDKETKNFLLGNQGKNVKIYYERIDNSKKPYVVYVQKSELLPEGKQ